VALGVASPYAAGRKGASLSKPSKARLAAADGECNPRIAWSRPLFRWAGSKRAIVPLLLRSIPAAYGKYVEPFAGSACLFFALRPTRAVLGDFNTELMHAYGVVCRHPRRVARGLAALPPTTDCYYAIRSIAPEQLDDLSRAVRFIYLNRYCFNGVYRTNRRNQFNVPMGTRPGRAPIESDFYRGSVALRAAKLYACDFQDTLGQAKRGDVAYLDPPYSTAVRTGLGEYGYGAFAAEDLHRLLDAVEAASRRGVCVILSYAPDKVLLDRLADWSTVKLAVLRQVGGGSSHRGRKVEILTSNTCDLEQLLASHSASSNAT